MNFLFMNNTDRFFNAALKGDAELVCKLLDKKKVSIKARNEAGNTSIHYASQHGHVHVVQLLLDRNADIEAKDNYGNTALHFASWKGRVQVVQLLLDRNANIEAKTFNGDTALHVASFNGHVHVVQILLNRNANIEAKDGNGNTALHAACDNEYVHVVQFLLNRGANIYACNNDGNLPVDTAMARAHQDVVDLLRKHTDRTEKTNNLTTAANFTTSSNFLQLFLSNEHKRIHDAISAFEFHQKLVKKITNIPEIKIYYTLMRIHIQQDIVSMERAKPLLSEALSTISQKCTSERALVAFKMILEKFRFDGMLDAEGYYTFDNRAEVSRIEYADFIIDMKQAIQSNTHEIKILKQNVDILDRNVQEVNKDLHRVKTGLRFKKKVEGAVTMVSMCLNAVSFGIAGGAAQLVGQILNGIVDFTDTAHIIKVIDTTASSNGNNPQEGNELKTDFIDGVNMAIKGAASIAVGRELDKALKEGKPLVAIGFAAAIINPSGQQQSNSSIGGSGSSHRNDAKQAAPIMNPPLTATTSTSSKTGNNPGDDFECWPDGIFDDEKEDCNLELHCAVKYSDKESLLKYLEELDSSSSSTSADEDNAVNLLNQIDSQGRTALDLAALTGQLELMTLLEGTKKAKYKKAAKPAMRAKAKKRNQNLDEYKSFILASIE